MYRESNIKQILISKVITGIAIIYLLSFIFEVFKVWAAGKLPNTFPNTFSFSLLIYILVKVGVFCIQVFLAKRLFHPKKPKIISTNFNRSFHPFFVTKTQKNVLMPYFLLFFFCNIIFLFYYLSSNLISLEFECFYHCFIHYVIINVYLKRNKVLDSYPVEFLKSNKLRIIEKYQDYINHKIVDDEPHLTINQYFDVSLKSLPRDSYEKDSIEIKNPNAPMIPALVCKINDEDLAKTLRSGYVLKAKLIEIKEEGNLEIELSLTEK
jgi:hypothetical protein